MEQGTLKNNNHIVVIARECDNILFLDLFVDLKGRGIAKRERSSICGIIPQMITTPRSVSNQSQEPGTPPGSLVWSAGLRYCFPRGLALAGS